ncbi:polyisoprenoid-binding protein [Helicobacter didelphidarum]|uniref:Polyisoprenoid-binding protein n=1 Tax=Helicobacter didelphidarum TaxID=2040648 RepID=A0A3D8ILY5_9HELI|nr:YceI family protein [Helicobacter didelphidarum]RDU66239.1 polyisoprenoid-binding protein [Helicobacter didelphidarum]
MKNILLSAMVASTLGFMSLQATPYDIDESHSNVAFKIGHMVVSSVEGNFNNFQGVVEIDPKTKTLIKLEGKIDIKSINTRNETRDQHLQADKYLDTAKYPKGTFKMTKVSKDKKGIKVEADLTLKGVTKKVVFLGDLKGPAQNPMTKGEVYGLTLKATINRKDFNIALDTTSATMGEEVEISISLELNAK